MSLMASFQTSEAFTVQEPKYTHIYTYAHTHTYTHTHTNINLQQAKDFIFLCPETFSYVYRSINLYFFLSAHWSIFLLISISQFAYVSTCLFICSFLHLSINLSICVNASLCVYLILEISKKGDLTSVYYIRPVT